MKRNRISSFIAALLAVLMLAGFIPSAFAEDAPVYCEVSSYEELVNAIRDNAIAPEAPAVEEPVYEEPYVEQTETFTEETYDPEIFVGENGEIYADATAWTEAGEYIPPELIITLVPAPGEESVKIVFGDEGITIAKYQSVTIRSEKNTLIYHGDCEDPLFTVEGGAALSLEYSGADSFTFFAKNEDDDEYSEPYDEAFISAAGSLKLDGISFEGYCAAPLSLAGDYEYSADAEMKYCFFSPADSAEIPAALSIGDRAAAKLENCDFHGYQNPESAIDGFNQEYCELKDCTAFPPAAAEEPAVEEEPVVEEIIEEPVEEQPQPEYVEQPQPEYVEQPQPEYVEQPQPEYVEQPVQQTVEQPVVEQPVQQTVEQPVVEQPVQQTVEQPVVEQPAQQTVEQPVVVQPVQQPVEQPVVEQPAQQTVEQPVVEQPAQQTVEQPVIEQPIQQTVEQPVVEQPVQQTVEQPAAQQQEQEQQQQQQETVAQPVQTEKPAGQNIKVVSLWTDNQNYAGKRPESTLVYLYKDGQVVSTARLTAADGWTYTFRDLQPGEYNIAEQVIDSYTSSYSTPENDRDNSILIMHYYSPSTSTTTYAASGASGTTTYNNAQSYYTPAPTYTAPAYTAPTNNSQTYSYAGTSGAAAVTVTPAPKTSPTPTLAPAITPIPTVTPAPVTTDNTVITQASSRSNSHVGLWITLLAISAVGCAAAIIYYLKLQKKSRHRRRY